MAKNYVQSCRVPASAYDWNSSSRPSPHLNSLRILHSDWHREENNRTFIKTSYHTLARFITHVRSPQHLLSIGNYWTSGYTCLPRNSCKIVNQLFQLFSPQLGSKNNNYPAEQVFISHGYHNFITNTFSCSVTVGSKTKGFSPKAFKYQSSTDRNLKCNYLATFIKMKFNQPSQPQLNSHTVNLTFTTEYIHRSVLLSNHDIVDGSRCPTVSWVHEVQSHHIRWDLQVSCVLTP